MGLDSPTIVRLLMEERERLFSYTWAILGDVHLTEDVFQEVSLLAIEQGGEVAGEPQFRVWLRRAARHRALRVVRHLKRKTIALDESLLDKLETHWAKYDAVPESNMVETLRECIRQLTPYCRKLIVLRYTKGLRTSQIAEQLKRKVTAVRKSIARSHHALYNCVRIKLAAEKQGHDDE
jgi:RNA polymerase sigma-70 factor, ECF subfamily